MFEDISIILISVMVISAGLFFMFASLVSIITEPFIKSKSN